MGRIRKNLNRYLFPMWIADMDIKTAPEIVQAMKKKWNRRYLDMSIDQIHIIKVL